MQGPNALTAAQLQIAQNPALGGEMKVYVTQDAALQLASITIQAVNSGVPDVGSSFAYNNTVLGETAGLDLLVLAENLLGDSGPITVTVHGLDQNGAAQVGTAVFQTPAYSTVTDNIFQTGWAVDVAPTAPGNQWTKFLSFSVQATGAAQYGKFSIWAMPNTSRYSLIGATQEKSFTTPSQEPVAISAGLNAGAFVKPGMIPVGEAGVTQRWVSFSEGMARFDGGRVTARIDVEKEQKIIDQRLYLIGATLNITPSAGEGASSGEIRGRIMYKKLAIMIPQATGN